MSNNLKKEKRALVISGGGSKGAFAGGFCEYVIREKKIDYDIFVGTSAGSLLVPLLSIDKIEKIKYVYNAVTMKDVFNINPFKIKKLPSGEVKSSINHLNSLRMYFSKKKTLGEHKNLRKVIQNCFSEADFEVCKKSHKQVIVTVANLTYGTTEYKYLKDCNYQDFLDWMWASTSFVPFMSMIEKNGCEYADGGFGNYLPIEEAVNLGANVIDAIVLIPRKQPALKTKSKNPFELLLSTISFMHRQLANQDIMIGYLESIYNKDVKVNFYFTPRQLTKYSFHFDPEQMTEWWKEGFEYAREKFKD